VISNDENRSGFASLSGRRILVTGASTGIGRAIALTCAEAGADVAVHCRSSLAQAEQVADAVRALGRRSEVLPLDLRDAAGLASFVEEAFGLWGGLDGWVNNAGVDLLTGPDARRTFEEKLARLLDVDVRGSLLLSRMAGERMRDSGGAILNIGWDQAASGMGGDSGELFAAAKSAVMGFTRSLAVSLAPEVRVNCIAPGWIRTAWGEQASHNWQTRVIEETPLARWGTPEDVAWMARFLLSDAAAYITGQVINVNGGTVR
jgi:3-oxoacyl-[acyl-carrier protein] reductase